MRVLAIDTTAQFGSIALVEDDVLVEQAVLHSPDGFSQSLFTHLRSLLDRHGWRTSSVDIFAAAAGPGSFTGVRVGLAAVKGLAEAEGKQAFAVSNLAALGATGTHELRAAVTDARRGEVYGAVYNASGREVVPETVGKFQFWLEHLPPGDVEFISTDFAPFRAVVAGTRFRDVPVTEQRAIAAAVARIAAREIRAGASGDPAALDANYVRRSDAELFWKDH
jgi:tRNA threonylcarbamoyladenosine biosynthesis protein TsaB